MKGVRLSLELVVIAVVIMIIAFFIVITYKISIVDTGVFSSLIEQTPPLNFECGEYENKSFRESNIWSNVMTGGLSCNKTEALKEFDSFLKKSKDYENLYLSYFEKHSTDSIYVKENGSIIEKNVCTYNKVVFYEYYETIEVCTNNLSYAYCHASPDECNERYGIFGDGICFCERLERESDCVCYSSFECVEWGNVTKYREEDCSICMWACDEGDTDCVRGYKGWTVEDYQKYFEEHNCCQYIEEVCANTLSKLTCHDSVENCNRRYS